MTTKPYCRPWNAGLASETPAVRRRLSRLFAALADEINTNTVEGAILDDIRAFRLQMMDRLEAEGWTMSFDGGNRLKVREPGHKRPFKKHV